MQREGARGRLHLRLMETLERGARAQEHSRLLLAVHQDLDEQVRATLAAVRARREALERSRRSQSDS